DAPKPPPFPSSNLDAAIGYFLKITTMPPELAGNRRMWAQYSLGRALRMQGTPEARAAAELMFLAVLQRLDQNIADPLDLRNGAYGELGRLALLDNRLADATQWYFKQGHVTNAEGAAQSLIVVADAALRRDTPTLVREFRDPDFQRVVALYFVSVLSDDNWTRESSLTPEEPRFRPLLAALRQLPASELVARERFGALAFQLGDYELAGKLLKDPQQPFGHWVAAKLALYQGNLNEAAKHYAEAAKGFPLDTPANDTNDLQRRSFQAEWALLNLTRGDYLEALRQLERLVPPWEEIQVTNKQFWPTKYQWQRSDWMFHRRDVAWLAERVLTSAELMAYVDANPSATWLVRDILARRLVREGKLEAAARYALTPENKARIARFANALATRGNSKLPLATRARAAVEAATIQSNEGMQLRGADLGPDFASLDGNFEIGGSAPSDLASADERKRATASAVVPAVRYHYRELAAEELLVFAKALPARTVLKTAVLCAGAGLARHGVGDRRALVKQFYREYQRHGVPYKGDWNFGEGCPEI
ncbi:MAG: putative signal peptide protein, partial [Pseudomonadota bacterium]